MINKIKIVELIPYLSVGGAETFVDSLATNFPKEICDVTVVSMRDFVHDKYKDSINNNYKFVSLGKKPGFNFGFGKKLYKTIKEINPDIIHVHLNCVYYAAIYLSKLNKKIVFTIHSVPKKDNKFIFRKLIKPYIKKGKIIPVGITKSISSLAEKEYGVTNITTIYNGATLKNISPIKNKEFDFINVGRFSLVKNQLFLLDTFKELLNTNSNLKLCLIGYGELEKQIKNKIKELNVENNVKLITDGSNPHQYLLRSKIFVLPSKYEGFPITLIEAMNAGLPCIASSIGGIPDVVVDNHNGLLVTVDNKNELIVSMNKLLNDNILCDEIIKNNLNDVKKYDIKNTCLEYLEVFKK